MVQKNLLFIQLFFLINLFVSQICLADNQDINKILELIQKDIKTWPFKVVKHSSGKPVIEVQYKNETQACCVHTGRKNPVFQNRQSIQKHQVGERKVVPQLVDAQRACRCCRRIHSVET